MRDEHVEYMYRFDKTSSLENGGATRMDSKDLL